MAESSRKENPAATLKVRGVRLAFFGQNAHHHRMKLKLKDLRKTRGWTQEELADIVGCTKSHISEMESGKKNPSSPMLESLATAFDVQVVELIDGGDASQDLLKLNEIMHQLSPEDRNWLLETAKVLLLRSGHSSPARMS